MPNNQNVGSYSLYFPLTERSIPLEGRHEWQYSVLYLYHTLPWLRAVLYEHSCTVILDTSTADQYSCTGCI